MVEPKDTPTTTTDDLDGEEYAGIVDQFSDLDAAVAKGDSKQIAKMLRDHVFDLACRMQVLEDRMEKDEEAM